MATDLSTLTETELTELLSSATAYTKPEMVSFLKDNVSISDEYEWAEGNDDVTVYFTPISDLRALKYIALNQSLAGGGAVFFQLLRHPCKPRDHDVFKDRVYVAPSGQKNSRQTCLKVTRDFRDENDTLLKESSAGVLSDGSRSIYLGSQIRSKYRYGSHRPSKPVMMLYPQDLVATLDPKEAITLWDNAADLTYRGGVNGKISQYAADGINANYYRGAYCVGDMGGYELDANGEYVRNLGIYYSVSRKPTDKVTMNRVNNGGSGHVVPTALEMAKGAITLRKPYWANNHTGYAYDPSQVVTQQGTRRRYMIWAPELLVQGGRRRWFMDEENAVKPTRAFLQIEMY